MDGARNTDSEGANPVQDRQCSVCLISEGYFPNVCYTWNTKRGQKSIRYIRGLSKECYHSTVLMEEP